MRRRSTAYGTRRADSTRNLSGAAELEVRGIAARGVAFGRPEISMLRMHHRLMLLLLLTLLVGCDRVTKEAAVAELGDGTVVHLVDETLELRYTENRDTAFNLLRAVPEPVRVRFLQVLGPVSVIAVVVWIARHRFTSVLELASAFAILAGAIGNTTDRWLRGYVVDFVHLTHWPVFNVADICVTLGIAGLLVEARRRPPEPRSASG